MTALSLLSGLVVSAPVCLSAHALAGLMTAAEVDDGSVQAVTEWSVDVPADGSVQITLAAGESIQLQQATVLYRMFSYQPFWDTSDSFHELTPHSRRQKN